MLFMPRKHEILMGISGNYTPEGGKRRGRPSLGEDRLLDYAEKAEHPVIKKLGLEASRRGLSMKGLAKLVGRNIKTVRQWFEGGLGVDSSTIELFGGALGYQAMQIRALQETLNAEDERFAFQHLLFLFVARKAFFHDIYEVREDAPDCFDVGGMVRSVLNALDVSARRAILARVLVADAGLSGRDSLEVLADELFVHGFDLRKYYVGSPFDRQREAYVAVMWMREKLVMTPKAWKSLKNILDPFFGDYPGWDSENMANANDSDSKMEECHRELRIVTKMTRIAREGYKKSLEDVVLKVNSKEDETLHLRNLTRENFRKYGEASLEKSKSREHEVAK